jgi:SEC-C motif-containing protein
MSTRRPPDRCPCREDAHYRDCCGRYHDGLPAPTAAALMRSRYCAYVLGLADYLLATWHPDTRPPRLDFSGAGETRWLGLELRRHHQLDDDRATVEFVARYRIGGASAHRLHEISRFVRENGRWFYVDGEFPAGES